MNSISIVILSIMKLQLITIIIDIFLKCVLVTDMESVLFSILRNAFHLSYVKYVVDSIAIIEH